ncbi:MAG: hypothetical protein US52_C0044G0005, partial [candidate division WS6 bacterium GW2011_GWA2_37_6]
MAHTRKTYPPEFKLMPEIEDVALPERAAGEVA